MLGRFSIANWPQTDDDMSYPTHLILDYETFYAQVDFF